MYATGEGGYAKDYSSAGSRNSVFTESLLEHLGTPGLSLDELRRKVTMAVMEKTKQAQRPESHDSTNQAIYLVGQEDEEETASGHELLRTTTSVEELRARIAAAEAKVEVKEIPGQPGSYNAVAWLRPWLQMEELSASLRMVASIPGGG